ncbi:MAG: transcriptional repressor [Alphaproteobacteria bacterium]|nr:transcriptional repressor [Alphaproteobacteria bacterium]
MKYSKQREIILKTLEQNAVHPTADQVYALLHAQHPGISLATVYRNLNLLAEMNVIRKITGLDGATRFDHNTHSHHHFVCSKCHKVYDVAYEIAPALIAEAAAQSGLAIESCDITLRGLCPDCITKN